MYQVHRPKVQVQVQVPKPQVQVPNLYCKYNVKLCRMQVPTDANTLSINWSNVVHLLTRLSVQTALIN